MAIGPIFKTLTFGGVNSGDYGIYITGQGVYNAPERAVELVSVPGRNGAVPIDQGRWENIEVTYPAGTFGMTQEEFRVAVSDFRNAVVSQLGYQKLSDDYHPDEYRVAMYLSGLEVDPVNYGRAGQFSLVFNCKPQRYLTDGDIEIDVEEWENTHIVSGDIVQIDNPDNDFRVKSLTVSLSPVQAGTGTPSPDNIRPITGHDTLNSYVTGVNVWDEDWEVGGFNADGSNSAVQDRIRSKNYIPCVGDASYYIKQGTQSDTAWSCFVFYDANKSVIGSRMTVYGTFTTPSSAQYMKFNTNNTYGATYNDDISINYPSTDHDYHAYTGSTYETDLEQTVYGGTADVVNGSGTSTMGYVDLGTLNYIYNATSQMFLATIGDMAQRSNKAGLCSAYRVGNMWVTDEEWTTATALITLGGNDNYLRIKNTAYTDPAEFKAAMSGVQLVYELATPTDLSFTPQTVSLNSGTNNVWSDAGDVTVEYGKLPNLLENPTLFDAKPLLAVTGYGNINFNGYDIDIQNETMGEIQLMGQTVLVSEQTITFDTSQLEDGDLITVNGLRFRGAFSAKSISYFDNFMITNMTAGVTPTISSTYIEVDGVRKPVSFYFDIDISDFRFANTETSKNRTLYVRANANLIRRSDSARYTANMEWNAYFVMEGNELTVTFSFTASQNSGDSSLDVSAIQGMSGFDSITGNSTKSILGAPIYIDTDLGDAYKIEDGQHVSLNKYIDLGSELPVLAPGQNAVTKDTTVTKLEIMPRWWKL